jgi:hypothetical protein
MDNITNDEWFEISRQLESCHALFYQLWQMGRPIFTDSIETAAVTFNRQGDFVEFLFNKEFWNSLTFYERCFVIAHECLHVVLNHGLRTLNNQDPPRTNQALDVVVNHMLTRSFGFDRKQLRDGGDLCWVDTIWGPDTIVSDDESFEYYYRLMPETPVIKVVILDEHGMLGGNWKEVIDKLNEELTTEEKRILQSLIEKHCGQQAGNGEGQWTFIDVDYVKKKKKWETVIKKWSQKFLKQSISEDEQWARIARRFNLLSQDLFLPSEMEEDAVEKDRIPVFLMLDTSGSCQLYKERFWRAGMSLPKQRFDVRLFNFDEKIYETSFESKRIYGGGGTSFDIIEKHILHLMRTEGIEYPQAIFLISDGYGNTFNPLHPSRWYWFLTSYATLDYIPKGSKVFRLQDYE